MSRAIKCDRGGKFEEYEAITDGDTLLLPNKDLCSKCAREFTNWWLYPILYSVKSVEPLTESIDEYVSDGKVFKYNESKVKEIEKNINEKIRKGILDPKDATKELLIEAGLTDPTLGDGWKYSPSIPMPLPDDTDEGLKLETMVPNSDNVSFAIDFASKENKVSKPGTDGLCESLKKPRSTTNIKWDDYMVDKLFNLLRDGKNHEQAADYLGTTVYAIQGILYKIRNAKSGHNYYPYRRKYSWYFEKRKYRQWDNESIVIVLEDIKRLGTVAAAAKENNIPESSIYMVLNRVKASRNNPNHKYYPIYVQYADILETRVNTDPEPKSKDNVWTEERIKEALDLRTINGHSWNTVADIMGLKQSDIRSLVQGIAGSNGRIHKIAKEYGYGE